MPRYIISTLFLNKFLKAFFVKKSENLHVVVLSKFCSMSQCPEFPRYMTQFKIGSHVKVAPNWKRRAGQFSISPPSLWETLCNIDSLKASSHGQVAPLSTLLFRIIFQWILKITLFLGVHNFSPLQEQEFLRETNASLDAPPRTAKEACLYFNINGFVLIFIFFLGEWSNSDARYPIGLLLVNCDCPFSSLWRGRNAMSNRI